MPPYLAQPYFHLSKLPLTTKLALTGFQVSVLAALTFSAIPIFEERTHFSPTEIRHNFAPGEVIEDESTHYYGQDRFPPAEKSDRQRYDIVHPHSFLMPILFFILCHLMEMTGAPRGLKVALYAAGFAGMMFVIFAPVTLHRWPALSVGMLPALLCLWVSFATMILVPAGSMWFGRRV